jgi:FkbM family methyltransferase
MNRFNQYVFETYGKSLKTTAKVLSNKLTYAVRRATARNWPGKWLDHPMHWHRFPFLLRRHVLWSTPLKAWFFPEDESCIECMLHMPDYEPVDWVDPQKGETFLDVGAYVGWYSIQASRAIGATGRVVALEPDSMNRGQLERHLGLNQVSNVTVVPLVVWSSTGEVGWHHAAEPVWHHATQGGNEENKETITIDDLVERLKLERVDWIKFDIEGAEVDALKGAAETLKRFRPSLFIEIHETRDEVLHYLGDFGYTVRREHYDMLPHSHGWVLASA